jgi:hypothetical protein
MRIQTSEYSGYKSNRGTGLVELAAGFIFIMLIVFTFLDLQILLHGAGMNYSTAGEAARAASAGPPGKLVASRNRVLGKNEPPYLRAFSVVNSRCTKLPTPVEITDSIEVTETIEPPVPSELFGGPVLGTVTVTTSALIHPQFILAFMKMNTIKLTASKTFPYSWVIKSEMDGKSKDIRR